MGIRGGGNEREGGVQIHRIYIKLSKKTKKQNQESVLIECLLLPGTEWSVNTLSNFTDEKTESQSQDWPRSPAISGLVMIVL